MKFKSIVTLFFLGLFLVSKPCYSQDKLSLNLECEHAKTIMNTASKYEFKGFENKKGNILFLNALIKKEGIEYAVLFIDEKHLHRVESFFNRYSQTVTFRYKVFECVYTSDSVKFNEECFRQSKMKKENYLDQINERKLEISKIENTIGPSLCPLIYMYRYWLEKPFGWSRVEL